MKLVTRPLPQNFEFFAFPTRRWGYEVRKKIFAKEKIIFAMEDKSPCVDISNSHRFLLTLMDISRRPKNKLKAYVVEKQFYTSLRDQKTSLRTP